MRDLKVVWLLCVVLTGCAGTCADSDHSRPQLDAAGAKPLGDKFSRPLLTIQFDASHLNEIDAGNLR